MSGSARQQKPHRRPHKKSRHGCTECRRRRVKCDEKRPCCSVCMLRGVDCHYVHSVEGRSSFSTCQPASTSGSTLHLHTNIQPTTPLLPCNTNPPKFGIPAWRSIDSRELELMHHWCTRTCYSFTPSLTEHFRDEVGKEALRYDFLMNALLALTSFHVATEVGNAITARSHTAAALQYHNQALSGLREVLPDITASTCNPIFVSSAMLAICAVISPFLHTDMGEMKSVPDAVQPLMLPWLMRIDPGFMDELRKEHPMAVAVFMYWGVLLHRLDNMWWSKYSGKRLVRRLSATLDGCGGTWDQISEWCRVQVELSPLSGIELDTL